MDHHCLFLLKCIGYNNHTRFVWFIIFTVFIMIAFLAEVLYFYVPLVYPGLTYGAIFRAMFWNDGWVFSMLLLNIGSIVWAFMLTKYQFEVISKGQTTYFSSTTTMLNPTERFLNVIYFLRGKPLYATDLFFAESKKCCDKHGNKPIHQV